MHWPAVLQLLQHSQLVVNALAKIAIESFLFGLLADLNFLPDIFGQPDSLSGAVLG